MTVTVIGETRLSRRDWTRRQQREHRPGKARPRDQGAWAILLRRLSPTRAHFPAVRLGPSVPSVRVS